MPISLRCHSGSRWRAHALELWDRLHELAILLGRAEAHDVLDARAIVPAAIEEHDFSRCRQVRNVTLKVPLRLFALGRRSQCDDLNRARADSFSDALDGAALARSITTLEQSDDLEASPLYPSRELHELGLQPQKLTLVDTLVQAPPASLHSLSLFLDSLGLGFLGRR